MTNTTNYDLIIVEGTDKVNPLTQVNPNFEIIDEEMKKNKDAAISTATELLTGSIHGLQRANGDAAVFRFTATSNYTAGDTFTVDGIQVTALTPTGEALGNGAYIIGSEVLCCLKGTLLTMFLTGGTVTTADNALKLGGQEPSYYGTAEDVTQAQQTATAAGVLANAVQTQVTDIKGLFNRSTEEKVVGYDTDGKEIYEKTIVGSNSSYTADSSYRKWLNVLATDATRLISAYGTYSLGDATTNEFDLGMTNFLDSGVIYYTAHLSRQASTNRVLLSIYQRNATDTRCAYNVTIRYTKA